MFHVSIAQLAEQQTSNLKVVGSSPTGNAFFYFKLNILQKNNIFNYLNSMV